MTGTVLSSYIIIYPVIYDSGKVFLEHLLLLRNPSHIENILLSIKIHLCSSARRVCVSLNSGHESDQEEEESRIAVSLEWEAGGTSHEARNLTWDFTEKAF